MSMGAGLCNPPPVKSLSTYPNAHAAYGMTPQSSGGRRFAKLGFDGFERGKVSK
jgi:hypothetical protein